MAADPAPRPAAQPDVRASDADRTAVVDRLQAALAEGRITVEEFTERAGTAHAALTLTALEPLTRDLPAGAAAAPPAPVGGRPEQARPTVAVFAGATRKGHWVPARRETAVTVFGGVELDYRGAPLDAETLELRAFAVFGGVEITVPEGVRVELTGFALFGGREVRGGAAATPPDAPVLRVHAVAVFGGVEVEVRPRLR